MWVKSVKEYKENFYLFHFTFWQVTVTIFD